MLSRRKWTAILLLNIFFVISRTILCRVGETKHSYIDKDYPAKLPVDLGHVQAQFDCSARYNINSSNAEEIWLKSTDTRNGGFLRIGPDRRVFAVSMFHELHCMGAINGALKAKVQTPKMDGHIAHCLNYLRMFTLCNADATEEPVVKVSTLKSQGCAPSFIRRCSNWSGLYELLSRNYLEFHEFKTVNGTWTPEYIVAESKKYHEDPNV